MRKCLGCDEMLGKKGLIRIVRTKDGTISVDTTGKMSGRGAYICNDAGCLEKAQKRKSLERALKCAIPPEIYNSLKERIKDE